MFIDIEGIIHSKKALKNSIITIEVDRDYVELYCKPKFPKANSTRISVPCEFIELLKYPSDRSKFHRLFTVKWLTRALNTKDEYLLDWEEYHS